MNNKLSLSAALLLASLTAACTSEQINSLVALTGADTSSPKARLSACMMEEASNKVSDGSAFTAGISATAREISGDCIKKLALQAAGLDTQATTDATNILSSLMGSAAK